MGEYATLVKFGKRHDIMELLGSGLLYMSNLPYIWDIEDEDLRGDRFDGVSEVTRGVGGRLAPIDSTRKPVTISSWVIQKHLRDSERINVFCMYALRPMAGSWPVDRKNFRFGDTALVLLDPQAFIDRIAASLHRQGVQGEARFVEYVRNDYTGEVGPFRKRELFQYQSEWRLVCYDGPGEARKLSIGDIRGICVVMASDAVNQRVHITPDHRLLVNL